MRPLKIKPEISIIYLHRVPNYQAYPYFASIIVYRHHCFEVVGMFSMEQQSFKKIEIDFKAYIQIITDLQLITL